MVKNVGDLWDDSVLVKAFDRAISNYKVMHGMKATTANNAEQKLDVAEADTEHVHDDDNLHAAPETTAETGESVNPSLEFSSSTECEGSSIVQNGNPPPVIENPDAGSGSPGKHMISSDAQHQTDAASYPNGSEGYNQLLDKYYELEGQRQIILQQLNQYNTWSYQQPISSASTSEEFQASVPQTYDSVTCYCPYGCQNWAAPCNNLPTSCSGGSCTDKGCNAISQSSQNENSTLSENPDFIKTAMVAAKRALSSLSKEASANADKLANGGKDQKLEVGIGQLTESTDTTGLDLVLNAWYSAGFYTGKYLTEQSFEKRKRSQGP